MDLSELKFGAEIEFYLNDKSPENISTSLLAFDHNLTIKPEDGQNQYEVVTSVFENVTTFISSINNIKQELLNLGADLYTLPENSPPSSTQISFSLKKHTDEIFFSMLAKIMHGIPELILITNPHITDIKRYEVQSVHLPTKICWGHNNRSCLIRVVKHENKTRRLEIRAISNHANIKEIINKLKEILMSNEQTLPEPVWGNANDPQYLLPLIKSYLLRCSSLM